MPVDALDRPFLNVSLIGLASRAILSQPCIESVDAFLQERQDRIKGQDPISFFDIQRGAVFHYLQKDHKRSQNANRPVTPRPA
ncbi:hypothetical protein [Candidatus Binatus sp.]|uniref:hypothetical protein n=1 Tax=Candidatus Binatus sp. TaxID=2811406 RepID=UPI003F9A0766